VAARRVLAEHPKYPLHDFVLSQDMRWLAFRALIATSAQTVYVAPVLPDRPALEKDWLPISGNAPHHRPFWSLDGTLLYFYAAKDNYTCLYARRLNPSTKQPEGEPFAVRHFHGDLHPIQPVATGYGYTGDHLYLPLTRSKGNVWIAEPDPSNR
jgi:hypothetical protein